MIPFGDALEGLLDKLGLAEPRLMQTITSEWAELAGEPWLSRSKPVYVKDGALVVEAFEPSSVAFLKYGVSSLESRLSERFGTDVISRVDVRVPATGRDRPGSPETL